MDKLKELNLQRLKISLSKLMNDSDIYKLNELKKYDIVMNNKKVNLSSVKFNESCVFIIPSDLLGVISFVGLFIINKIDINKSGLLGEHSMITTDYMIANVDDLRQAMLMNYTDELEAESWQIFNYTKKDLVIWRLAKILGTGTERDTTTSLNSLSSTLLKRSASRKIDWLFFEGTEQEFHSKYKLSNPNVYKLVPKGVKSVQNGGIF